MWNAFRDVVYAKAGRIPQQPEYNLLARRNAPAIQIVQPVPVQYQGLRNPNRFNNGSRGGRQFQQGVLAGY
jgi:hypothetical protein